MSNMTGRDHIRIRLDIYTERARTLAFYAGGALSNCVFLLLLAVWTKTHIGWWVFGIVVFALVHLITMGLSAHFAEKSKRIRKRLDSVRS